MSEQQNSTTAPQEDQPKPTRTREEVLAVLTKQLRKDIKPLVECAQMYNQIYPVGKTLPEVLDAVTVPVPLRSYMILASLATTLVAIEVEREQAAAEAEVAKTV